MFFKWISVNYLTLSLNMKKAFLFLTMIMLLHSVKASYFEKIPYTIKQPDGSEINCFITGDEFYHRIHDKDDYTIVQAPDGYYYYAEWDGDLVKPSVFKVNSIDPVAAGLTKGVKVSASEYRFRYSMMNDSKTTRRGILKAPVSGLLNNIVIYIRFADDPEFTTPRQEYMNLFGAETGRSMKTYFREVSYDKLNIESYHYPGSTGVNRSYQDSHNRNYFLTYNATTNPEGYRNYNERYIREQTLLTDAVQWINENSPVTGSLNIDADDDQLIDNVCFIIRGHSAEWSELLWGHKWNLSMNDVFINGKLINNYTFQPENHANLTVLCHEMAHSLGSPDLYHYENQGVISPVGCWDLMGGGSGHMLAYMKWRYSGSSWINTIPVIETSGAYRINPLTSPGNNCYKIKSPVSEDEFFIVEYRIKSGSFESNLPGSGLLVYRIDTRYFGDANGPPDEIYVFRPGGSINADGESTEAFLCESSGRISINDNSDPCSFLQNGDPGGLLISGIREENGQMVFNVTIPGIQNPQNQDYYINEWNDLNIKIFAPGNYDYFIGITGSDGKSKPEWAWRDDKTSGDEIIASATASLKLSEEHDFTFSLMPTDNENRIRIKLYRKDPSGLVSPLSEIEFDLMAKFRTEDLVPPRVTRIENSSSVTTNIVMEFSENILESTLKENMSLSGSKSGKIDFNLVYITPVSSVTIDPIVDFRYDEDITLVVNEGIMDLAGLKLDGDSDGVPGQGLSHTFRTERQVYAHDFSVVSISLSDTIPVFTDDIIVYSTIRNEGTVTEPQNQKILFYVNDHIESEFFLSEPMIPGQEFKIEFIWHVEMHPCDIKIICALSNDENTSNDEKSLHVVPYYTGYILLNGKADNTMSVSLCPGNKMKVKLELINDGVARIDASLFAAGNNPEWITLSDGENVMLSGKDTASYTFEIEVPAESPVNFESRNFIRFRYGFDMNSQMDITIKVIPSELTINTDTLNLGPDAGDRATVEVKSNTSWNVRDNADWVNLSATNGTGNGTVNISATAKNPFPGERRADIFFSAPGSDTLRVRLIQAGYDVASFITITGNRYVDESSTCSFKCIAHYDNGFMEDVTTLARWSVNNICASINHGELTTTSIDSDQLCLISALYNNLSDTFRLVIRESVVTNVDETGFIEFLAYPNPASDLIYLKSEKTRSGQFIVEVSTISGEIVISSDIICTDGMIKLDIAGLKKGMYIITLRSKKIHGRVMMIKQ